HNNGDGTFTDVAQKAGVTVGRWSETASWGDYDRDGLLDLYVTNYAVVNKKKLPPPGCRYGNMAVQCAHMGLRRDCAKLFHNRGDGTFEDVTEKSGIAKASCGFGFAVIFGD